MKHNKTGMLFRSLNIFDGIFYDGSCNYNRNAVSIFDIEICQHLKVSTLDRNMNFTQKYLFFCCEMNLNGFGYDVTYYFSL